MQLLVRANQPVHASESLLQLLDRIEQLRGVQHIGNAPVRDLGLQRQWEILERRLADHSDTYIVQLHDRRDHSRGVLGQNRCGEQRDGHGESTVTSRNTLWNPSSHAYIGGCQCDDSHGFTCAGKLGHEPGRTAAQFGRSPQSRVPSWAIGATSWCTPQRRMPAALRAIP